MDLRLLVMARDNLHNATRPNSRWEKFEPVDVYTAEINSNTWGPDGSSNHMDHRLVGASMTQVVVNKVWDNSIALYYYGRPSDHLDSAESKILRGQDKRYLTTRISYTDEDIEKAYNSIMCHKSQVRPTTLEAYKARKTKNGAAVYLRKFIAPTKITYSIFE